jgi:uncharacterized membrane protein
MFANLRRKKSLYIKRWIGGVLLGAGLFQLYDGTVQHKWLKLHQIRYNVDIMPYDLTWNITASIMTLIGCILILKTRNKGAHFER